MNAVNARIRRAVLAAVIICGTLAAGAKEVVAIRVRGRYYTEPATIRVTVAVEPDQSNRSLRIEADGDRLFRSSEVSLDGNNGERLHTVEFKNLPAGQYVLTAEVRSVEQIRGIAREVLVVGTPADQR